MLTLARILEALTGEASSAPDLVITDAAVDSRKIMPGGLFIALPGELADGHDYVGAAFAKGAVLALVDREMPPEFCVLDVHEGMDPAVFEEVREPLCLRVEDPLRAMQTIAAHWRDVLDLRVIGITGSVGKSTTKELAAEVLSRKFHTAKNPGNLNNEIGLPLSILKLTETHERAVLEMGFYVPGEIAALCAIARPQVGVVTNISHVHMSRAGSLDAIVQGKRELVESLPSAPDGVAILNADDPLVYGMSEHTRARVFTYGLSPNADLWASNIEGLGLEGLRFILHSGEEHLHVKMPLLGRHSVHTALRAAAVGLVEGLTWNQIIAGLRDSRSQLRLVAVSGPGNSLLLDDTYNAAPSSVIAALNLLAELEGRRVAVLGDMLELGAYEEPGHRRVGARAAQVVDELITVGKLAGWIADEAIRAGLSPAKVSALEDSQTAIEFLRKRIGEGDVVLVKGSHGMRMDLIVAALEEIE